MTRVQHTKLVDGFRTAAAFLYLDPDLCVDSNGDTIITILECELVEEEIELILRTMNANAFNFIVENLESGVHTVEVQAFINTDGHAMAGEIDAKATIGKGSVTIEQVRMANNEEIEL